MRLVELNHKIEIYFWNGWIFTVRGINRLLWPILIDKRERKTSQSAPLPGNTIAIALTGLGLGFIAGYLFIMLLLQ